MEPHRTVNLSELSGTVEIEPGYHVQLPEDDCLSLVAGGNYPTAATRYDHPCVAARQDKVFHTRHYRADGRKQWSQHAGRDYYFIIPRDRIALVFCKGYSYVPVHINGLSLRLNVTGGTVDGWTDFVQPPCSVGIRFGKKQLDQLAEAALTPDEARGRVSLELPELSASDADEFVDLIAGQICRNRLEQGHRLFLREGWSYQGSRGPFILNSKVRRRRHYIAVVDRNQLPGFRATYGSIDWTATAAANGFPVFRPIQENRLESAEPQTAPRAETA